MHLSEEALKAIHKGLPSKFIQALKASGTGPESFQQFSILDHRGKTKFHFRQTDEEDLLMIGRLPLRKILAAELEGIIRWGAKFSYYENLESGVVIHFSNAKSEEVDILVGADGVHSSVARQLLGRETAQTAGVTAIAGKTMLTEHVRSVLYSDLFKGPSFAIGPGGIGMFLTLHDPKSTGDDNALIKSLDAIEEPYVIWSVGAADDKFHTTSKELDSKQLEIEAIQLIRKWDIRFLDLIKGSVSEETASFHFWFPSHLSPWENKRITLIGDAVHPMPPTGGLGASTAIIDAVNLAAQLLQNDRSTIALQKYQSFMLEYAPRAVEEARPPLVWQRRFANVFVRKLAMSVCLPLARRFISFKQRKGK
ncbi:2-polyprenyl-6-methoxyphenol hydroxylase-like FAD-dependent oxidoreductase [Geomicrobium halophilum]|uniref:2-polyprenyl-6-methoxyphenol hydroxylase-like FAD-dependent oxidoreductase n=1 Tax=Geomicrobium halophilum TaxID=549000 RepID=A0A841PHD4_9BACL|nr:FAD-dependent monooxygenase [Geomicrobium halophilum]MBB6448200.1 2-polyprenyl-6-methoxyphenol hydroxylase-like FAD-dependent oxidoreductase [Geomicrobium halophilum]